jgi:hypothetical protein
MHLNPVGHQHIAFAVLEALGVPHAQERLARNARPVLGRAAQLRENAAWTRDFLGPWVHRRLTGRSSGDSVSPKRPTLAPIEPPPRVG